ncbi:endosialidase [Vibrio phage 1.176.O._10N.261.55.F5]|nr:endosialidase [Vibrio phage 1.176.O._10N.261.55.F5]
MTDCSSYPTKSTAQTFKLDAETVNEVVTSSDDRTPPASDGLTKKTLAGIENDASNQLADIQQRADEQYSDINNQYVLRNKGDYATDPLLEFYYEFTDFNGLIYFPIVAPYQVDSATYPDPSSDPNLRLGQATDDSLITSTGSTTPRRLDDRFADVVNVMDFGAVGDGASDDTGSIQLAIDNNNHVAISGGTFLLSGVLTIPQGKTVVFIDAKVNITGSLVWNGRILSNRDHIFIYTDVVTSFSGTPQNEFLYPEWFGATKSTTEQDTTVAINDCLQAARNLRNYHVKLDNTRGLVNSYYWVDTVLIPRDVTLEGAARGMTVFRPVSSKIAGPIITDDPATGAAAIKLKKFNVDCMGVAGLTGIDLGHNPAFVWGVEGFIEDVYVRDADVDGFSLLGSVTYCHRIAAVNCKRGIRLEGGSISISSSTVDSSEIHLSMTGGGHKVTSTHFEGRYNLGAGDITTYIEFDSGATECQLNCITLLHSADPAESVIALRDNTTRNSFTQLSVTGGVFSSLSVPFLKDETVRNGTTAGAVTEYYQNGISQIAVIDDSMLSEFNEFNMLNNVVSEYIYIGNHPTGSSVSFRLPSTRANFEGMKITITNATASSYIRVTPGTGDTGSPFYGTASTMYIDPQTSMSFYLGDGVIYSSPYKDTNS